MKRRSGTGSLIPTIFIGLRTRRIDNFSISQLREALIFGVTTALGVCDDDALLDLLRAQAVDRGWV
jgi:hypothetical protein